MILYEFEGKKLLKDAGIKVPTSQLIDAPELDSSPSTSLRVRMTGEVVLKAQVLSGKRAQAGGIEIVNSEQGIVNSLRELIGKLVNKEKVEKILIEEKVEFEQQYYVSISYDTARRLPVWTVSKEGGTGIEERGGTVTPIDLLNPEKSYPEEIDDNLAEKLLKLFLEEDCTLLEINPLVRMKSGTSTPLSVENPASWIALDAKIKLDDSAFGRHPDRNFPPRSAPGHTPSQREIAAKKIDEGDYRGVAGSAYFDLEGDIGILASGGGASLTAMDALLKAGGKPANYTEYGGNPPKEKVNKLTRIVLSKPNLKGLWVVGAVANFTDIYETLSGLIEAIREVKPKPKYPIVIRRGGPRDKEAFRMLRKVRDLNLWLYSSEISITESAKIMVDLTRKYRI